MSDRVSRMVLLCEDDLQERLTKAYLKRCGLSSLPPEVVSRVASREQQGGNYAWVLAQFPKELHACRQRRAKTLLIVLIDADDLSVEERRRQLLEKVRSAGLDQFGPDEPAVLLIPKRHIETWVRALQSETVTEDGNYKTWEKATKEILRSAADTLYDWARPNATPGPSCVPSLKEALPLWRRIG